MSNGQRRQNETLADIKDLADELRHLLMLVFWAAQAQGQNGGPFAVGAQIALAIVERQVECLQMAHNEKGAGNNAA